MDRSIAAATICGGKQINKKQGGVNSMMGMMPAAVAAMRKGPWTEEEDAQLVWFVRLFGERRWDFLAKVSGLKRTGKSCRLRWVNYLHPGLRRGRITADEERLILELHGRWGSRWSRIARSLPGRTDNEIKNFWRTRTRKHRAAALGGETPQRKDDDKTAAVATSADSSSSSSPATSGLFGSPNSGTATSSSTVTESSALRESGGGGDGAELDEASTSAASLQQHHQQPQQEYCYTMDQLWNEIPAASCYDDIVGSWGAAIAEPTMPSSPVWEFSSDFSLWKIDDEEYYKKMLHAS